MIDFKIRTLKRKDINALAKIQESILKKKVPTYWKERVFEKLKKSPESGLVAEYNKQVVGFIIGDIKTGGFGLEASGWIEMIGVEPKFMGKGIGKKLGNALLQHFRTTGLKNVFTVVRWDSGDLLAFFKSIGFDRSNLINLERKL